MPLYWTQKSNTPYGEAVTRVPATPLPYVPDAVGLDRPRVLRLRRLLNRQLFGVRLGEGLDPGRFPACVAECRPNRLHHDLHQTP